MKLANKTNSKMQLAGILLMLAITIQPALPLFAADTPFSKLSADEQLSEDILRELVGFKTTQEHPEESRKALQSMADRLLAAGFPEQDVQLVNPAEGVYGLVARYRGIGMAKPVLTLAHIDVVTAMPNTPSTLMRVAVNIMNQGSRWHFIFRPAKRCTKPIH